MVLNGRYSLLKLRFSILNSLFHLLVSNDCDERIQMKKLEMDLVVVSLV
jgi:hypothetical protein